MVKSLDEKALFPQLALLLCKGVGLKRIAKLHQIEPHASNWFNGETPRASFRQVVAQMCGQYRGIEMDKLQQCLKWARAENHHILGLDSEYYPEALKQIASPPYLLFVKGNIKSLSSAKMCVVGTRHPSTQGQSLAYQFSRELVDAQLTVISGLAAGIDQSAHRGALEANGTTLAVLPCSLDKIYPKYAKPLANQIEQQGALISEIPIGTATVKGHFTARNRIMSGLSQGVLVVEAAIKSGTMVTARYALEQNREVFAIPASILQPYASGCHYLIQQGAKLVTQIQDILEELNYFSTSHSLAKLTQEGNVQIQNRILQCFDEQRHIDEVVNRLNMPTHSALAQCVALELQGYLQSVSNGFYKRLGGESL